ncbi:MAG: glycosyltransferase family 4 protein [Sphaerospermopsis sp. SIO1G2]|nr:glycosyltransferase family 4 protein [Sphaerospermopsis sp. SIO1G2]
MSHTNTKIDIIMLGAGLDVKGGITSVEKLILDHAPPELEIQHIATFAQGSGIYNIKVFIKSILGLIGKLLKGKVDLVHIHFAERGSTIRKAILAFIVLLFQCPLVIHSHGATYKEFYLGLPKIIQNLLRFIFGKAHKLIVLSQSWEKFYAEDFGLAKDKITILYNPVNLPISIPNRIGRDKVKFVFLGRIGKRGGALDLAKSVVKFPQQDKGSFDLIRAFANLPELDKNQADLVLAGNGDLEAAQTLISELKMEHKITVYSWLTPEERDKLLSIADAFVLPSYHEGLPMSMLEAMAWGLPVIVTPVGGIPEVITDQQNGLLVEPGNYDNISQRMSQIINDENLRISLGKSARRSVESLDIQNYILNLTNLYKSILES